MTQQGRNEVVLEGTAGEVPEWSHENHGIPFYRVTLRVRRLSGQLDVLPVLIPEEVLRRYEARHGGERTADACAGRRAPSIWYGQSVRVRGQFRSFNNRSGVGRRLVLSVYAREMEDGEGAARNEIQLCGSLCKPPIFRRTPLGRSICDLMLAVPRRCGRADYLPVIAWGRLAAQTGCLRTGDTLALEGRIQSRLYHKMTEEGLQERTAYEVSMMRLLPPREACPEAAAECE